MRRISRLLWAFLVRDFQEELSYRLSFLLSISGIFFSAFTFFFVSELFGQAASPYLDEYGVDYFSFVIIGIAFNGYFTLGLAGFARALRQSQTTGTLEAMVMTPVPISMMVVGSAAWSYVFTTFRVLIYLLLGTLLFTLNLEGANYLGALLSLMLSIVAFASVGIIAAAIIMIIKRGEAITALVSSFASLVGGIFYPVEIMPSWLQAVSAIVPVTYAVRAMRLSLLVGASWSELLPDLLVLAGFTVVLFPTSLIVFRLAVERARKDGSLTHY